MWSLEDDQRHVFDTFDSMTSLGVEHFKNLYKALEHATLAKVIRIAQVFPGFVEPDENQALMEEVLEEELKCILQSFQKDKSPGPDGWMIEFFLELYDLLG